MPDQNQSDPNQNPVSPPTGAGSPPSDQPNVPPVFSPVADLPPIPPAFQSVPADTATPPISPPADQPTDSSTGSAAPPDTPPIISSPKKKFGGGKVIATILGILLLVGGIGAGIFLTQQSQDLREKAGDNLDYCGTGRNCAGGGVGGGSPCLSGNSQQPVVICCPAGQTIRNGSCSTDPPRCGDGQCETGEADTCSGDCGGGGLPNCGTGRNCVAGGGVTGATPCLTGNTQQPVLICCPGVQTIKNGACSDTPPVCNDGKCETNEANTCPGDCAGSCNNPPTGINCNVNGGEGCTVGSNVNLNSANNVECVVNHYWCRGVKAPGVGCQDTLIGRGETQTFSEDCGTEQIDVICEPKGISAAGCYTDATYRKTWVSRRYGSSCGGDGGGGDGGDGENPVGQCLNVKAYDDAWVLLSSDLLSALEPESIVNFCVAGSTDSGTFDKAQFKINATLKAETTTHRPGSTDFCQSYAIAPTDTTIEVKAKIHHATLGSWFGEAI